MKNNYDSDNGLYNDFPSRKLIRTKRGRNWKLISLFLSFALFVTILSIPIALSYERFDEENCIPIRNYAQKYNLYGKN